MSQVSHKAARFDGRSVLVVVTQSPDGEIGFTVPAINDDLIRRNEDELLYQLENLAIKLKYRQYPFGFLREKRNEKQ